MHFTFGALGAMLILTNCLRKSFVFQLPQHQWNAASAHVDYRKSPDRSPRLLSVQFALTPGLYPGPGVYPGPGFYPGIYGIHAHRARVGNKLLSELVVIKSSIKPQPVL